MNYSYSRSVSTVVVIASQIGLFALLGSTNQSQGAHTFRGISRAESQPMVSGVFDTLRPNQQGIYPTDLQDDFSNRVGTLAGTEIDGTYAKGTRMGFVPPVDTRDARGVSAQGRLPDGLAAQHGTWMEAGHASYTLEDGRVSRSSANEPGVNCLNWRVTPDLGNFYLLEMTAKVADGETVSLGFFDDLARVGASEGLAGDLGLLVLGLTRSGTRLDWNLKWEGDLPGSVGGTAGHHSVDEDVRMELGWMDNRGGNVPDLFEGRLNDEQLAAGNMGRFAPLAIDGSIDVFAVGFELSGTSSSVDRFVAAVPEPSTLSMGFLASFGLMHFMRRRRSGKSPS